MLFLVFGASGSGKTAALEAVRGRAARLACHDFDEIGVPPGADRRWRQEANESWLARVREYEAQGLDVLLAGQTPYGELLASPSADGVEVSALLLDCADAVRAERLAGREADDLDSQLAWAAWLRGHAADPGWQPEVIREDPLDGMRWDRWQRWERADPRWRVALVDSSELSIAEVADEVLAWIDAERRRLCP
jgi:hypothetical protein